MFEKIIDISQLWEMFEKRDRIKARLKTSQLQEGLTIHVGLHCTAILSKGYWHAYSYDYQSYKILSYLLQINLYKRTRIYASTI